MLALNVQQFVSAEIKDVYNWLEEDFHPLLLCKRMSTVFDWLATQPQLEHLVPALKQVTVMRLLKQVSCLPLFSPFFWLDDDANILTYIV
jgi:translation initiation factor 3 subunit A